MRSSHPQFDEIVSPDTAVSIEGCITYEVVTRMKMSKQKLKSLHNQHFRNILKETEADKEEMLKIQSLLPLNPMDDWMLNPNRRKRGSAVRSGYLTA